jgi:TonB family protein
MTLALKSVPESAPPPAGEAPSVPTRRARLSVLLVTSDDSLWPVVSPHFDSDLVGKQVDGLDELMTSVPAGQPAVVLWDARAATDPVEVLMQVQMHSSRFSIVPLDEADRASVWAMPLRQRQIAAVVNLPIKADELAAAIRDASEEAWGRLAVLGDASAKNSTQAAPTRPRLWFAVGATGLLVVAATLTVLFWPRPNAQPYPNRAKTSNAASSSATENAALPRDTQGEVEEKVESIIDRAQQAMTARHFVEPAEGSALALYREASLLSPDNAESKQGLQRLAEILIARVNSALDARQFDVALQSLESARSIDPDDPRLRALDTRMATLRAELGPAQIQAAIAAQNFDRASQLIDDAEKAKLLPTAKLAQLRDDVRKHRDLADATHFVSLTDARLQQDRLIDPLHDNATYYLGQARAAGVGESTLQPRIQEFVRRATQAAQDSIKQHRVPEADRLITELRNMGAPASTVASLQQDLMVIRQQMAQPKSEQPPAAAPDASVAAKPVTVSPQAATAGQSTAPASPSEQSIPVKTAPASELASIPEVTEVSLTRRNQVSPVYPRDAEERAIQGWVNLHYTVTADGKVEHIAITGASPSGVFNAAAKDALQKLRYEPYLRDGKPIAVTTAMRLTFRLDDSRR